MALRKIPVEKRQAKVGNENFDKMIAEIRKALQEAERVLLVSHIHPDGDAVGSLLGMGLALEAAGKQVEMVLSDGLPGTFRHLSGSDKIVKKADGLFDFTVVLDCSDLLRAGDVFGSMAGKETRVEDESKAGESHLTRPDLNIDHHITNLNFARYNLVEPDAVATSELLALKLPALGLPITAPVAEALLTGMITDTIGFRTNNMTPRALRVAANLVEAGANLPDLYQRSMNQRSFSAARYWGQGLVSLQREDRIVWTSLTLDDRRQAGYPGRDDADLVNILASVAEAEVAVIFIEQSDGTVKVSWRSQNQKDVSEIALMFGGGGHRAASGAEIEGSLPDVQKRVLDATRKLFELEKNGNPPLPS